MAWNEQSDFSVHFCDTIVLLLVSGYKLEDVDIHHRHNLLWRNPSDDDDDNFDSWRREENEEVICSLLAAGSLQVHSDNCLSFSGLLGHA